MTVKKFLAKGAPLVFDGGMGTYYSMRCGRTSENCEQANLECPQLVGDIHREYLEAGCRAIKTNTFGANLPALHGDEKMLEKLLRAGWHIAKEAAGDRAFVFADIGPINGMEPAAAAREYRRVADVFLQQGAQNFLFETNSTDAGLAEIAAYLHKKQPAAFVLVSFAVAPDGYTREGLYYKRLLKKMAACPGVDAVGLNCVSSARQLKELAQELELALPFAVMPNAGYPVVVHNRTVYEGDPAYFARALADCAGAGASILGGCCGTTPVHLAQLTGLLALGGTRAPKRVERPAAKPAAVRQSAFWQALCQGKRVTAVELDPPKNTDLTGFMEKATRLKEAGADTLTIADCPIARARMDSSLLACKVKRELQMEAMPHLTCRDRNLNATKALLLGLAAEGVENVLAVTGDPVPTAERDEVKSVYQFNSRKLARFITTLGEEELPSPLHTFGALNLNARNFDVQLAIAKEKVENGVCGFLTQPVLTEQALVNLKRARKELPVKLLGGILPVVSERNARYMDAEVNGIKVAPQVISLYEGKDRQACEQLAVTVSLAVAKAIAPYTDGYYLITPFGRAELMARILEGLREL